MRTSINVENNRNSRIYLSYGANRTCVVFIDFHRKFFKMPFILGHPVSDDIRLRASSRIPSLSSLEELLEIISPSLAYCRHYSESLQRQFKGNF
jgi:hypothetical protein